MTDHCGTRKYNRGFVDGVNNMLYGSDRAQLFSDEDLAWIQKHDPLMASIKLSPSLMDGDRWVFTVTFGGGKQSAKISMICNEADLSQYREGLVSGLYFAANKTMPRAAMLASVS